MFAAYLNIRIDRYSQGQLIMGWPYFFVQAYLWFPIQSIANIEIVVCFFFPEEVRPYVRYQLVVLW